MYDTCAFDGCHRLSEEPSKAQKDWRELPLWLWETHNDVNVRLMGERLEQRKAEKPSQWESQQARWPALYSCPNCWRDDRSWEEEEVYRHLRGMYWTGNPSYIKIPPSDGAVGNGGSVLGRLGFAGRMRWKLSFGILTVAVLVLRLYSSQKVRRYTGKHKK